MKIILGQRLYEQEEVAKMLGVGKATITNYIRERGLNTTKIERKKYLTEEEIRKMITPQTKK